MFRKPVMLSLCAALAFAPLAAGQHVPPAQRNAALQYATVFYTTDADLFSKTGDVDLSKVGFDKAKAPEEFLAAAELLRTKGEGTVGALLEASRLSKCDFELATEKGIMVLLPHLGKMRGAARLLRLDARRHLLDGDAAGAAERLAAMVRIGLHAKGDELLISSLVSVAITTAAMDETEAELDSGLLTPAARQTIAAAFEAMPKADPFATKAAIRGEQRIFLGWVREAFHGPHAGQELAKACQMGMEGGAGEAEATRSISAMTDEQVRTSVDLLAPYYDQVVAAWDAPDGGAQLEKLGARVSGGEFGPMGQVFAPAVSRARDKDLQVRKRVETLIGRLASK